MDRLWRRGGIPDPMVWLAFVAAQTSTILLGTNVVILPEHQPVVFAKTVATVDALSHGRVRLGIGVGALPEEYDAVDMSFTNRGRRMDESIEAMRALWTQEVASYSGEFVRFANIRSDPRPANGTIPLHIGGTSDAALRRAGQHGDGYFPWVPPGVDVFEVFPRLFDGVRAQAEKFGRDPDQIEFTGAGARSIEQAEKFAEAGADRMVIAVRAKEIEAFRDELLTFGQEVIAPTRDL